MDEKSVAAPLTIASATDAQGNVVVWDNGPQPPEDPSDPKSPVVVQYNTDLAAWKAAGGFPVPTVMPAGDANQRLSGDPRRYTLEPHGIDDGAVAAKVKELQDRRKAAKKAAQDHIDAAELAMDRKEAIDAVMAEQRAAAEAKKAEQRAGKK